MNIDNNVVYIDSSESALEHPRHSLKRLELLSVLTERGDIALQEQHILTVYTASNGAIYSFEVKDPSYKIYPVVTNTVEYINADKERIRDYCKYKINFLHTYRLPVLSNKIEHEFDLVVARVSQHRSYDALMALVELYLLRQNAQDLVMGKSVDRNTVETRFLHHISGF